MDAQLYTFTNEAVANPDIAQALTLPEAKLILTFTHDKVIFETAAPLQMNDLHKRYPHCACTVRHVVLDRLDFDDIAEVAKNAVALRHLFEEKHAGQTA